MIAIGYNSSPFSRDVERQLVANAVAVVDISGIPVYFKERTWLASSQVLFRYTIKWSQVSFT